MSKKSDQRDLHWARQQFPLLARRSDAEILRVVKEARGQFGLISKFTGVGGAGLGFLLGYASGIASEQLVRRRVEAIVRAPVKRY